MKQLLHVSRCLALGVALGAAASCSAPRQEMDCADTNHDGSLEVSELKRALAKGVHEASDLNGDGIVTFEEWKEVMPEADLKRFNKYNAEGTPGLSLAEAINAMEKEKTFDDLVAHIDTNNDGVIDPGEAEVFHDAMEAADGRNDVEKLNNLLK